MPSGSDTRSTTTRKGADDETTSWSDTLGTLAALIDLRALAVASTNLPLPIPIRLRLQHVTATLDDAICHLIAAAR